MPTKKVDMYYRFTSDLEPTDEQLETLMREVGEEVRRKSEEISKQQHERIYSEFQKAKEYYGKL